MHIFKGSMISDEPLDYYYYDMSCSHEMTNHPLIGKKGYNNDLTTATSADKLEDIVHAFEAHLIMLRYACKLLII